MVAYCSPAPSSILSLIFFVVLLSSPSSAAAASLTNEQAISIIIPIFLVFLILDVILLVALFAWCRQQKEIRRREWIKSRIRQRSKECLDELSQPTLSKYQMNQIPEEDEGSSESSIKEGEGGGEGEKRSSKSNEYVTVEVTSSSSPGTSPERGPLGEESHLESKSFENRRKESQGKRAIEQRRESEKFLLEGEAEESLKATFIASQAINEEESKDEPNLELPLFEKKESRSPFARQQSSDYRRDPDAPLMENEIIVESPVRSKSPDFELQMSQASGDIFSTPKGFGGGQALAETSFNATQPLSVDHAQSGGEEAESNLNSTSGTSIGWSSVFKLVSEVNTDVNGLQQENRVGGGKLAQEGLMELLEDTGKSKTSLNLSLTDSKSDITIPATPNTSFASASYSGGMPGAAFNIEATHERTQSFDKANKYSPSTYYTPQHAIPRPRGSDPSKLSSISLTSSPVHRKKVN